MAQKKSLIPIIELERDLYKNETLDSGEITSGTYHIPVIKYNEGKKEIVNVNLSDVYEKASFDELQQQIDELESDKMDKFNLSDYLTSDALDDYVTSGDFNSAINDLQEQIDDLNSDIELLSDALDNYVTKETPISIKYSEFEDGSDMENSDFIGRGYIGIQKHVYENDSDLENPQSYNWIKNDSMNTRVISDWDYLNETPSCFMTKNTITLVSDNSLLIDSNSDGIELLVLPYSGGDGYDFSNENNADFKSVYKFCLELASNTSFKFIGNTTPSDPSIDWNILFWRDDQNNIWGIDEATIVPTNEDRKFFITLTLTKLCYGSYLSCHVEMLEVDSFPWESNE